MKQLLTLHTHLRFLFPSFRLQIFDFHRHSRASPRLTWSHFDLDGHGTCCSGRLLLRSTTGLRSFCLLLDQAAQHFGITPGAHTERAVDLRRGQTLATRCRLGEAVPEAGGGENAARPDALTDRGDGGRVRREPRADLQTQTDHLQEMLAISLEIPEKPICDSKGFHLDII